MIGFLKRWFATKSEVESVYSQLDTIAHAIQELRKDQLIRQDEALEQWRPEAKPEARKVLNKPVVLPPDHIEIRLASPVPRHIANAKVMIGKVGGHAEVRKLVKQGVLHASMQGGQVSTSGKRYDGGKLTLYNHSLTMPSNNGRAKRYSMVLRTAQEAKQVIQYFRSIGIPVKEQHK